MRRRWRELALAGPLALAAALAACGERAPLPGPDVAARVAGVDVRYGEIEAFVREQSGESSGALSSEALSRLLDQYLIETLLVRLAVDTGHAAPGARRGDAVEALLAAEPADPPGEAELVAVYEARRAELARPERLELRQLVAEQRASAERARRELAAGAPFERVLATLDDEAGSAASGEQGALARDDLPPAFAEALFRLPEGGVSQVFEAEYGYLVFQVVRRLPAATPSFEEARPLLERELASRRADAALARRVGEARGRYPVEVYYRNLPFSYRGEFPVARPYDPR